MNGWGFSSGGHTWAAASKGTLTVPADPRSLRRLRNHARQIKVDAPEPRLRAVKRLAELTYHALSVGGRVRARDQGQRQGRGWGKGRVAVRVEAG